MKLCGVLAGCVFACLSFVNSAFADPMQPIKTFNMICAQGKSGVARTSIRKAVKKAAAQAGIKLKSVDVSVIDVDRPEKTITSVEVPVSITANPLTVVVDNTGFNFTQSCTITREVTLTVKTKSGEKSVTKFNITLEGVYVKH